jgi:hypothetical protein
MDMIHRFAFDALPSVDLCVDAVYEGGRRGNAADDPLPRLLSVSNQGGFRYRGTLDALEMLVLTSSLDDPDWPDGIDRETGIFTYYGDNKRPGRHLHETPRNGNEILRRIFEESQTHEGRRRIPPIFIFASLARWRDAKFLGLAVPGTSDLRASEDLVAIWRSAMGQRFQNYRARFTILDAAVVSRAWIRDIIRDDALSRNAPTAWTRWVSTGHREPLVAKRSLDYRSKPEQLPSDAGGRAIIDTLHAYFLDRPHDFEACAAGLAKLMLPDIASLDLTRPSRDGGRDATGTLRIGYGATAIFVDFALEAKCYDSSNCVGVRDMSRLISRLRHRQFGILVTTSYVDRQTYKEIKDDQHPIVVISGADIAELLKTHGYGDAASVLEWLRREYPADASSPVRTRSRRPS